MRKTRLRNLNSREDEQKGHSKEIAEITHSLYFKTLISFLIIFITISPIHAINLDIKTEITPSTVSPGNDGFIKFTISNLGSATTDITIGSITLDSPLVLGNYTKSISSVDVGKTTSFIVKFSVPSSATSGFYTTQIKLTACETTCKDYIQSAIITVQSPSILEIISVRPVSLNPGENSTLRFVLSNRGESDVSNIVFSWNDPTNTIIPLGSDNRKFISFIKGNAQQEIPIDVVVSPNAESGLYPLTIRISYTEKTGVQQNSTSTTGLFVKGDYNLILSLESQDPIAQGTSGSVTVRLANAGTSDAEFLVIKILPSELIASSSVVYVGKLSSDDYDTQRFQITTNAAKGVYPLKLQIDYKDPYGQSYSEIQSVDVAVSSKDEVRSGPGYLLYIIVFFIIVVIFLALDFRRRRRKKK